MSKRDYYQVLGVTQDATHADIRAAFVRLSKRHHPDLPDSEAKLPGRVQDVLHAYHCLSDTQTRAAHDRALDETKRLHFAQQRAVRRRLQRYDRRYPHPVPRPVPRNRWWALLALGVVAALVAAYFRLVS